MHWFSKLCEIRSSIILSMTNKILLCTILLSVDYLVHLQTIITQIPFKTRHCLAKFNILVVKEVQTSKLYFHCLNNDRELFLMMLIYLPRDFFLAWQKSQESTIWTELRSHSFENHYHIELSSSPKKFKCSFSSLSLDT